MLAKKTYKLTGLSIRPYEMSIWTLTDDFITILKPMDSEYFGTILDGKVDISDDGTQELSFSIPIYIKLNNQLIENPVWRDTYKNQVLTNMKKIKVIFNKGRKEEEGIFEFVIESVTENHNSEILTCEVKCSGLAFHELGKLGYKVVFSPEEFYLSYENWFSLSPIREENEGLNDYNARIEAWKSIEPSATLDYWNNLMGIEKFSSDSIPFSNKWYYKVQMDWSNYEQASERASDRIYEEPYVSSWNNNLLPKTILRSLEKARLLEKKESNLYNLTQELAKTFGVFCRYEYQYDDNYHITARIIVYYNNFLNDSKGIIGFSYPYLTSDISRIIESNDLITKLYIDDIDSGSEEFVSITEADVNRTKEDYILNFDYLYNTGTMSKEQYDLIKPYEDNIAIWNNALMYALELITAQLNDYVETEAKVSYYTKAVAADTERINSINEQIHNLELLDKINDGVITNLNPRTGVLVKDNESNLYTLSINEKGVIFNTLEIYLTYNFSELELSDKIESGTPIYDEFGNLIKVAYILVNNLLKNTVYVTYSYSPTMHYLHILNSWNNRLALDQKLLKEFQTHLETISENIQFYETNDYKPAVAAKEKLVANFNRSMGSLIREGHWTPDTYTSYDTKCKELLSLTSYPYGYAAGANTYTNKLFWDQELFDNEQNIYYNYGLLTSRTYYLCIDMESALETYADKLDKLSVFFYDYDESVKPHTPINARYLTAGSTCLYAIAAVYSDITHNRTIKPILVLTGASNFTETEIAALTANGQFGIVELNNGNVTITNISSITWISDSNIRNSYAVCPRFEINSNYLKKNEDSLLLSYNNVPLKIYEDFYVLGRTNASKISCQYITIRPEAMFKLKDLFYLFTLIYNISNMNSAIYLDAVEVAKENSLPKVSYELKLNCLNVDFLHTAYQMLSRIVSINDVDLHFNLVYGYISRLSLNLDFPNEDNVEIKNYKNKFEDLFSCIVASTEAMQRTEFMSTVARNSFNVDGTIKNDVLLNSLDNKDFIFSFNDNNLTFTEVNGIMGKSSLGMVSMRSEGIFTSLTQDNNGDWIWTTAIAPDGVRAEAITSGKLNIKDIVILSGDETKFQLNKDGLYAFKSFLDDTKLITTAKEKGGQYRSFLENNVYQDTDHLQYVVHNSKGIFLVAKSGDLVYDETTADKLRFLSENVNLVELSWNGFIIRDWNAEPVFWADTKGNLNLKGIIEAGGGLIANWTIEQNLLSCKGDDINTEYVALLSSPSSDYVFWAGNVDPALASFAIKKTGEVVLKNATIAGTSTITTTSGEGLAFLGQITASSGWLGGDTSGLSIFTGGIGDGHLGWIKTTNATDIGFWAGSANYKGNLQSSLKADTKIKFKIFGDGTSEISSSTIKNSSLSDCSLTNQNLTITSAGEITTDAITINGGSITIGDTALSSLKYFMVDSYGALTAKTVELDYVTLKGINALYLGNEAVSSLDANFKILTSALADATTITSMKSILDGTSKLSLDYIADGDAIASLIASCSILSADNKLSWSSLSTSTTNNTYNGQFYSISHTMIDFTNGKGIKINAVSEAQSNPLLFVLETNNNGAVTAKIAGEVTAYTGKIGNFSISSGDLYYADNNSNSCTINTSSIVYSNSTGDFFNMTNIGLTVPAITVTKQNDALTFSYTTNDTEPVDVTITLSGAQLAALKELLSFDSSSPTGYSAKAYIRSVMAEL